MDCLFCYNVFNKEVEYKTEPPPNPEMCLKIICKLFNIPQNHPDIRGIFEDPSICRGCNRKLKVLDKVLKSTEYEIRDNLVTSKEASEVEERMSKSSMDRLTLMRVIETEAEAASIHPAQNNVIFISIGGIANTTNENLEQSLTQDSKSNDGMAIEEPQVVEMEIPVVGQANDSSGTNFGLKDCVFLKAILGEDGNTMPMEEEEEEEVEPIQIQCSSQIVPANIFGPGPSRSPIDIVARNGVEKEARICQKPLEITSGATGFQSHQAGKSGTTREIELVILDEESSEEESDEHLKCRFCSKTLSSKYNLKLHVASLHTGQLPFQCRHCSRQFIQKNKLQKHLGNNTPTKCVTCDKIFPSPGCLMQHKLKVHQSGRYARKDYTRLEKNFSKLKDGRFKCRQCAEIVKTPYLHLMVHPAPKYPCFDILE